MESNPKRIKELIDRASEGSLRAMDEIVDLVEKPVRAYLALTAGPAMSIDDLAQDTLITGLQKIGRVRDPDQLVSFFQGTAKNKLRAEFRKQGRRNRLLERHADRVIENLGQISTLPEQETQHGEVDARHQALLNCLKKVPNENQTLLTDYYCSRVSTEQIADSTSRSKQAVRALLYRLRKSLRDCIKGELQSVRERS
jgi:RNA polymerase sigma factor (sigma-70 family)